MIALKAICRGLILWIPGLTLRQYTFQGYAGLALPECTCISAPSHSNRHNVLRFIPLGKDGTALECCGKDKGR